jgi:hypothetical protein
LQKGNQKAIDRQCKKVIRRLWIPFCIVYPPPSDYLFALSIHRLLINFLHCLSTFFSKKVIRRRWTDNAKRQSEGGGQTMQKGNQKAVDRQCQKVIRRRCFCIVCPPPSDYLFALSIHRLLITFLHCLYTAF